MTEAIAALKEDYMPSSSTIRGIALGVALSPIVAPIVLFALPLVSLVGALGVALGAYAMLGPLQAKPRDFIFAARGAYVKALVSWKVYRGETFDQQWDTAFRSVGKHRPLFHFIDEERVVTYGQIEAESNRIARVAQQANLKSGDTVALFMRNRPEYVAIWLGLMKIGVRVALVNSNLRAEQLSHSFKVSECKAMIIEDALAPHAAEVELPENSACFVFYFDDEKSGSALSNAQKFNDLLSVVSSDPLPAKDRSTVSCGDPALYVYTSGTTGMPKAAKITHTRLYLMAIGFATMCRVSENDRIYNPLPLYHSAGGLVGVGLTIYTGAFMVLRRKFSARAVGVDLHKYDCTVMQYIGEMCRFALQAPENDAESQLNVRAAIGNGLRPEIWQKFQERFHINEIYEFYGATEGAGALINTENKAGAVGFLSPLVDPVMKIRIGKVDEDEELVRDKSGRVVLEPPGSPGELLIEIVDQGRGNRNFDGYQSASATAKKVVKDVLVVGDSYFRTGDLLKRDKEGFVYFVDRLGDTFRWRGENVSTAEVATTLAKFPSIADSDKAEIAVYGAQLEGQDGRAGMLAIAGETSDDFDFDAFVSYCSEHLTSYAQPRFVRFVSEMPKTSTHKVKKTDLKKQGANPELCGEDALFFYDVDSKKFAKLDQATYDQLCSGEKKM